MKLIDHVHAHPDKPAVITDSGDSLTYKELEDQSIAVARLFKELGLQKGDCIGLLLCNSPLYFVVAWAAQRSGLYYTPINWHLSEDEICYIVEDCEAKVLFADARLGASLDGLLKNTPSLQAYFSAHGEHPGFTSLEAALTDYPVTPLDEEPAGMVMFYSSGTTGRPKGIKRPLPETDYSENSGLEPLMENLWGFTDQSIYLSPAPLYHAAPLGWCMSTQRIGGTAVIMDRFDAERFLALVDRYAVTHTQCVPTMFVRMLELPDAIRAQFQLSSLQFCIHAAAPCPISVKEQMIAWWGPLIFEFYAGSEGFGLCAITTEEWLQHKGSVGKPLWGRISIIGDDDQPVATGEVGKIYFAAETINFTYHNAPEKRDECILGDSLATYGDMGYVDSDGYLYLVDRRTDLILSGGVNIYPSEVEAVLREHSAVSDVAVVGAPDPVMGEVVAAVIELRPTHAQSEALKEDLLKFCAQRIAKFKTPRMIDFERLPRTETGKMLRRVLKERYKALATGDAQGHT